MFNMQSMITRDYLDLDDYLLNIKLLFTEVVAKTKKKFILMQDIFVIKCSC